MCLPCTASKRYRYNIAGTNWRAVVAFLISVCPNIPGMAATVNPDLLGSIGGADKMYDIFYFWGYGSAFLVYVALNHFFPATETLIPATIHEDEQVVEGQVWTNDGLHELKVGEIGVDSKEKEGNSTTNSV